MKYIKLFENFDDIKNKIHEICTYFNIKNYTINDDGTVDVDGNVDLYNKDIEEIPLNFRSIMGNFDISHNRLSSLEGCPEYVDNNFDCSSNNLKSLKNCPGYILGDFICGNNKLTSLEYCPSNIPSDFMCNDNNLTSLDFCPKYIGGSFDCTANQLTSIEGCPKIINEYFDCSYNKLISFKFIPKTNITSYFIGNDILNFNHLILTDDVIFTKNPIYNIWELIGDKDYIELFNDYDCIRGKDIVIDRLNEFLEEIDKPKVKNVDGYNNI